MSEIRITTESSSKEQSRKDSENPEAISELMEISSPDQDQPELKHIKTPHGDSSSRKKRFICTQCNKSYKTPEDLGSHTICWHKDEFRCQVCTKTFFSQDSLTRHATRDHPDTQWRCEICDATFRDLKILDYHKRTSHALKCPFCKTYTSRKSPNDKAAMCHHIVKNHDKDTDMERLCPFCTNKNFPTTAGFIDHLKSSHVDLRPYSCPTCKSRFFVSSDDLQDHIKSKHRSAPPAKTRSSGGQKRKISELEEGTLEAEESHSEEEPHEEEIQPGDPGFLCPVLHCAQDFEYLPTLVIHINNEHKEEPKAQFYSTYELPTCKLCKHTTDEVDKLKNHYSEAHQRFIFCEVCQTGFETQKQFTNHSNFHKKIKCDWSDCMAYFDTEEKLEKHLQLHEDITHLTEIVETVYSASSEEISSQEIRSQELKSKSKETEESPGKELPKSAICETCGKLLSDNHDCGDDPNKCTLCLSKFETPVDNIKHLIEKHVQCPYCSRQGKRDVAKMKKHVQQKHPEEYKALYPQNIQTGTVKKLLS